MKKITKAKILQSSLNHPYLYEFETERPVIVEVGWGENLWLFYVRLKAGQHRLSIPDFTHVRIKWRERIDAK